MMLAGGTPGPGPEPPTPTPTPILPEGYTQISYILNAHTDGYIDTGYLPNNNTRLIIEFDNTGYPRNNWGSLFGARNNSYGNADYSFNVYTASTKARDVFGNNGTETEADLLSQKHVIIDKNKNVTTITNVSTGEVIKTITLTDNTFSTPSKLILFNQNRATNATSISIATGQSAKGKIFEVTIYDGETLVRHYIPCKNPSNVVGLYDLVNDTFVTSSQSLTPGPVIDPTIVPTNRFRNKSLAIIGDSISTYDQEGYKYDSYSMYYPTGDVTSVDWTWWKRLMDEESASLEVNLSYSGSCVSSRSGYPSLYDRSSLIGNADTVIIALGTNDSLQSKPLGSYDYDTAIADLDESSFRSAYIKGIKGLLATNPNVEIVCAIFSMDTAYRESITAIAQHYGFLCIDCGNNYSKGQGVHPSAAGMREIEVFFLTA